MPFSEIFGVTIDFILFAIPIVLPIGALFILFEVWVNYAREKFLSSQDHVLIRILPPRDIFKTPAAMELFINSLYQTGGEATPVDRLWHGKVRAWFSLEIASHGGEVAFYIWTRKQFSEYLQAQIYAQYPGIETKIVEDYAEKIDYYSGKYSMFGIEYRLTEPDPVPIKTYIDYGLHESGTKEEFKVDPLTATLEFFGSLKKGENAWIQIIVRAHKKEDKDPQKWFKKTDLWQDEAKELIKKIKKDSVYTDDKGIVVPLATKGQGDKIYAIERSVSKLGFDVGIRAIYIAEKDVFNGVNIGGLIGTFKQYGSSSLNGFRPALTTSFDYWWQDIFGKKTELMKREIYEAYLDRGYFWRNFIGKPRMKFILNSEEIATLFHFPGSVAGTPGLTRIQSRKSEAPPNLPI